MKGLGEGEGETGCESAHPWNRIVVPVDQRSNASSPRHRKHVTKLCEGPKGIRRNGSPRLPHAGKEIFLLKFEMGTDVLTIRNMH